MAYYDILEDGQVINTIVADLEFMQANYTADQYQENTEARNASPKKQITRYQFRSRFTTQEKVAMYDSTDTLIRVFLDDIQSAEYIDLAVQDTIDGVSYLESQGLIAAGRAAEILSGE